MKTKRLKTFLRPSFIPVPRNSVCDSGHVKPFYDDDEDRKKIRNSTSLSAYRYEWALRGDYTRRDRTSSIFTVVSVNCMNQLHASSVSNGHRATHTGHAPIL